MTFQLWVAVQLLTGEISQHHFLYNRYAVRSRHEPWSCYRLLSWIRRQRQRPHHDCLPIQWLAWGRMWARTNLLVSFPKVPCNDLKCQDSHWQVCCRSPVTDPSVGTYYFDGGNTTFLRCSATEFVGTAFFSNGASLAPIQAASALGSVATKTPAADATPPAQRGGSGNNGTIVEIVFFLIAFAAVAIAIAVCCCARRSSRHTPTTSMMSNSHGESRPGGRLSTCARVSAIGSFFVGLISLVVAIASILKWIILRKGVRTGYILSASYSMRKARAGHDISFQSIWVATNLW